MSSLSSLSLNGGIFSRLLYRGVCASDSLKEQKRTVLLNALCLVVLFVEVVMIFVDLAMGLYGPMWALVVAAAVDVAIYRLNSLRDRRYRVVARALFLLAAFAYIFANANWLFVGKMGEFGYFFVVIATMVLFDSLWVHLLALSISLVAYYVPNTVLHIYDPAVFGYSNIAILFIIAFLLIRNLLQVNELHEAQLQNQRDTIALQRQEAEDFHNLKQAFLLGLVHDIKTPLTLLEGYGNLLRDSEAQGAKPQRHLQAIMNQVQQINLTVTQVLKISKLQSASLVAVRQRANLNEELSKAFYRMQQAFDAKGQQYTLQLPEETYQTTLDAQLLQSIFSNLLTNALKYVPATASVSAYLSHGADGLHVGVADTGPGFDATKWLSGKSPQSPLEQDAPPGSEHTGIGLLFSKQAAEAMGLELEAVMAPGQNTIALHIADYQRAEASPKPLKEPGLSKSAALNNKSRILLVEDELAMQQFMAEGLLSYDVVPVSSAEEALGVLDTEEFDLLISDYQLPGENGTSLVAQLKDRYPRLPVIFVTGQEDLAIKRQMFRLGVEAYLTKPFVMEELVHSIQRTLALKQISDKAFASSSQAERDLLQRNGAPFILEVKSVIAENLNRYDFSVETVAERFSVSRSTLNRRTKALSGQTVQELITEARLQRARDLWLANPFTTYTKLTKEVGLKNSTHLRRMLQERWPHTFNQNSKDN